MASSATSGYDDYAKAAADAPHDGVAPDDDAIEHDDDLSVATCATEPTHILPDFMPNPLASAPPPTSVGSFAGCDGAHLFEQAWLPEVHRGTVALVHGYAEHSGRYAHVAGRLRDHGIAVHTYDQRGYGRSPGRRAYVPTFQQHVDDLALFLDTVRSRSDGPLWLFGHSMGGAVVLNLVLQQAVDVAGLVLSSPAIQYPPLLQALRPASRLASRLLPHLPTIQIGSSGITHDEDVQQAQQDDPLYYRGHLPARTGHEIMQAGRFVQQNMNALTLPFYLFQGTADEVVDPEGARRLYAHAASGDKTLRLYEGLYHETLNERLPDRRTVLDEMTQWLTARLPA